MTPADHRLLLCALLLCGLAQTVLSQRGHCSGNHCVALFRQPDDFQGAQQRCRDSGGHLYEYSSDWTEAIPSWVSGTNWVDSPYPGSGAETCFSLSVGRSEPVHNESCARQLDGFLCQYTIHEPCGVLQPSAGPQVRYAAHEGFEVTDSDAFPPGTIAAVGEVGAEYPSSKHLCFSAAWTSAPWKCEVLTGGCEHGCDKITNECTCPPGKKLHANRFSCAPEPSNQQSQCGKGFRLGADGKSCVDVDECAEGEPQCTGAGEECLNTRGGFECTCKEGFDIVDGVCEDFSNCDDCEHVLCEKLDGVYQCACRPGYRVSPQNPSKCEVNCTERDCPARCDPSKGKDKDKEEMDCFCPGGYIKDVNDGEVFCTDIDECDNKPCQQRCENLHGGYRCACEKGFKLQDKHKCARVETDQGEEEGGEEESEDAGSGSSTPTRFTPARPTPAGVHPSAVPPYVKTGSVLGIAVFLLLCAALLFLLVNSALKRCGSFELSPIKRPDIDIFYLQQVTTETYKKLSFDRLHRNDAPLL